MMFPMVSSDHSQEEQTDQVPNLSRQASLVPPLPPLHMYRSIEKAWGAAWLSRDGVGLYRYRFCSKNFFRYITCPPAMAISTSASRTVHRTIRLYVASVRSRCSDSLTFR